MRTWPLILFVAIGSSIVGASTNGGGTEHSFAAFIHGPVLYAIRLVFAINLCSLP